MKNSIRKMAGPALLTLSFLTASAWAQITVTNPSGESSQTAPAAASHAKKRSNFVEKRIADLHAQLKISSQQSQQWDAFAQTMRDNAQKTDEGFQNRNQKLPSLNADDAMKSYAALAQMHADNMQKLTTAFSALYSTFSDDQKKTADVLFRNEHAKRHMAPHKHKPAASDRIPSTPAPASE